MSITAQPWRKERRGATAVEFALVAPVFFMMVFGMIEFGRMIMVEQVLTNASREGARFAVLDSSTPVHDLVVGKVNNYLQTAGISPSAATITISPNEPTTAKYADGITVTVQVPFGSVTWLPSTIFIGSSTNLKGSTVMHRETTQ